MAKSSQLLTSEKRTYLSILQELTFYQMTLFRKLKAVLIPGVEQLLTEVSKCLMNAGKDTVGFTIS